MEYRQRRRRARQKGDPYESAVNTAVLNSMASKDATMTLQAIESREGDESIKKNQLS